MIKNVCYFMSSNRPYNFFIVKFTNTSHPCTSVTYQEPQQWKYIVGMKIFFSRRKTWAQRDLSIRDSPTISSCKSTRLARAGWYIYKSILPRERIRIPCAQARIVNSSLARGRLEVTVNARAFDELRSSRSRSRLPRSPRQHSGLPPIHIYIYTSIQSLTRAHSHGCIPWII